MNGRIIASGLIGVLVGCGIALWVGGWQQPRYQAVQLQEGIVVRLNTQSGEMRVFARLGVVNRAGLDPMHLLSIGRSLDGRIDASDVKIVTDARAVERCESLRTYVHHGDRQTAAEEGGDTIYRQKDQEGVERGWIYRCATR